MAQNRLRQFISHSERFSVDKLVALLQERPHLAAERAFLLGKVEKSTIEGMKRVNTLSVRCARRCSARLG